MAEPIQTFTAEELRIIAGEVSDNGTRHDELADVALFAAHLVEENARLCDQLQQIQALPAQWRIAAQKGSSDSADLATAGCADELDAILQAQPVYSSSEMAADGKQQNDEFRRKLAEVLDAEAKKMGLC